MSENRKKTDLLIVSGEASGHLHAQNLVKELKSRRPDMHIRAFGTAGIKDAGCELAFDLSQLAVMGIKQVLPLLGRFIDVINAFRKELKNTPPKVVVLIDYPGLNFLLARTARWHKIPVVYYCCPQFWAWAPWRAKKIRKLAKKLLVIFPFEKRFFSGGDATACYVGHPLCDELSKLDKDTLRESVRARFNAGNDDLLVGLFPGSRKQEVAGLGRFMTEVASILSGKRPHVRFVCSLLHKEHTSLLSAGADAPGKSDDDKKHAPLPKTYDVMQKTGAGGTGSGDVHILYGAGEPLMAACDVAVVASGTASLELAYFAVPMIVVYPLSKWKQKLFNALKTTPFICSTNILAGKALIAEHFVSTEEDLHMVAEELARFIDHPETRKECSGALEKIGKEYLQSGATAKTAGIVLSECGLTDSGAPPDSDALLPEKGQ